MQTEKIYTCLLCEKEYNSYMGLWRHKKNKHKNNQLTEEIINKDNENENEDNEKENNIEMEHNIKSNVCKFCNKEFLNYKNKWRHEKKNCKEKKHNENKNENKIIQINNNQTIGTQNIINNNININNNNIVNITFNKLGCEDISILNQDEIEEIINNGLNSIIKLIEFINFNKEHPQNHTFCTTSLNNKYVSTLNTDTLEVEKQRKIDIFDNVLRYSLTHIDMLKDNITNIDKKKQFSKKIEDLYNIIGNHAHRKIYHEQLNVLSYNKRNIVNKTWDTKLNNNIDV